MAKTEIYEVASNSNESIREEKTGRSKFLQAFTPGKKVPPPPAASVDDSPLIPEVAAGFLSNLTFQWITPLLSLGYARPLEASDLYKLQDHRSATYIADKILASFDARRKKADAYNARLASGEVKPGWRTVWWTLRGNRKEREKRWRDVGGKKKASLVLAMNDSVKWWFWSGGILKVIGDTAQMTSPLVVKAIITYATESYYEHKVSYLADKVPTLGKGIALAFILLILQLISSICSNHFFYRSTSSGVLLRGGLIAAIYSRTLRLTSRARSTLTNGKLVNHISTDVSRIDFCCGFFHMSWTSPIQLILCLVLLWLNLGPSALAGFAIFVLATPMQTFAMKKMFALRQKSMQWTDKRAKLLQELLGGMRVIKFFAWEMPFLKRIFEYRQKEMAYIRSLLILRSANNAIALTMPTLASVISFATYSLTGHQLGAANIFSSLTLFNLLRLPLMFLPLSFSTIADAANACERLYEVFVAETLEEAYITDPNISAAIEVQDASFTWDSPPPETENSKKKKQKRQSKGAVPKTEAKPVTGNAQASASTSDEDKVFNMKDINMTIPRGQLLAIVGPVGTGKTSLLQGLIGEMRKTSGTVKFGGTVAYCPQVAWVQNATIRDNICFGRPFEAERYWQAVRDACLEPDLAMLPNGDLTEVGERVSPISLSGGQKQRINICRAVYCDTDIQIFDDPLSALDAHVGRAVFHNVLQGSSGKTRILVTHALHFLPQVDYIYTIVDGRIAERGTYGELMANDGAFSKFINEFGSKDEEENKKEGVAGEQPADDEEDGKKGGPDKEALAGPGIMQAEERNTGAVDWDVYKAYLSAGKGYIAMPLLFLALVLSQGSTVMGSYWLVYWEELKWHRPQGFYMGVYAALGVGQAFSMFLIGISFAVLTYFASQRLHKDAIERVMHAPMSFFETTPLGRIMNRFSKDIDTIDNLLGDALRMFASTFSSIVGAVILISIILPWFLIAIVCVFACYTYAAIFYRSSARELKRLDAILRSSLYSHFSESLSGLSTIRAYGEAERFRLENESRINIENRAYWLTVTNQRWLGMRLDFLGTILTLVVAILTVSTRFTILPSKTGLTLAYILSVQQAFSWMVRQTAEVENNMNSVERIVYYATDVEQEAPYELPDSKPPADWPAEGSIEMKDMVLSYRPELPSVLKGLSMSVRGGEKVGIVGRTGAGKSSLMTALFRIVELTTGRITIDGVDISKIGLSDLRRHLSIIPQDPLLFSGTLRSNLDPFGLHDDAKLWDALKRSYLVETPKPGVADNTEEPPSGARTPINRFTLDTPIEDEGGNLSIGQRSLVSLARALVKNTKVLILDEATASVDYETDRNIQDTIATQFQDRTILCIAHRLRTIISYDRICVLDAGQIAEFDTPTNLYAQTNGIFRGMCERSSITLEDIRLASKLKAGEE